MHEGVPREYKEQRARTRPEECDEDQKKVFKATRPEIGRESPERNCKEQKLRRFKIADPQTGVAPGWTRGRNMRSRYRCSMCSAIHINSRSWLRSSSTHEPSDPPLKVVFFFFFVQRVCSRARSQSNNFFFSKMKKGNEALRAPGEAPEEGKGGHTFKKKKGDSLNLALPTSNGRSSRRETESISRRRYPNPSEKSNVGRSPP